MQENILCVVFYLYKQQEKRLCLLNAKAVHAIQWIKDLSFGPKILLKVIFYCYIRLLELPWKQEDWTYLNKQF